MAENSSNPFNLPKGATFTPQNNAYVFNPTLPKPSAGSQDVPGSIQQYADQSANPASTVSNPSPSEWQKFWAGTPWAPASASQNKPGGVVGNTVDNFKDVLINTISDIPAAGVGLLNLLEPWKYPSIISGLIKGGTKITKDLYQDVVTGTTTGDWSGLAKHAQEASITAINHPLQAALLLDGSLEGIQDAGQAASDITSAVTDRNISFGDTKTGQSLQSLLDRTNTARNNIASLFKNKTTLAEHTVELGGLTDEAIKLNDQIAGNENADSFNEKNINEQKKIQSLQDQLNDNFQKRVQEVNEETANQLKETKLNGFQDLNALGRGVSDFFNKAFAKASGVYDQFLGSAKINVDGILDGLKNYKEELLKGNKFKSADVAQREIDQLTLRNIIGNTDIISDKDAYSLYETLRNSGLDSKLYENKSPEELKARYKPLTSEYLKTAKNAIYNSIERGADESSLNEYNQSVMPQFDKAFGDAIESTYGKNRLSIIKQNDADWAELKANPLSTDTNPSLSEIQKNWNSFVSAAEKVQGGQDLIDKIRNYAANDTLKYSENMGNPGTFDYKKIFSGIDKYGKILGDTLTERLQRVANDNRDIQDEKYSKSNSKAQFTQQQSELEQQQKSLEKDAKSIGSDTADIIKNIQDIDSPEKLESFIQKTGKTAEQIGSVFIRQAFAGFGKDISGSRIEPELDTKGNPVLDKDGNPVLKTPNYDIGQVGKALDLIKKLGGKSQEVLNRLLGQTEEMERNGEQSETQKQFSDLQKKYEEWEKAKTTKSKTLAGRAVNLVVGALVVTMLPFGKFYGIRKILSAFDISSLPDEISTRARVLAPEGNKFSAKQAINIGKGSAAVNAAISNNNDND